MTFGQYLRGNYLDDKKKLTSILRKKPTHSVGVSQVSAVSTSLEILVVPNYLAARALRAAKVQVYGTESWFLLYSGSSPNVLS